MVELSSQSKEIQKLRKLTKSEKRLSILLVVALFATGNFYGLGYLFDLMAESSRDVSDLRSQEHSNDVWLRERDLWLKRQQWIDATQPRIRPNQVPQSELLESVTTSAKADQLEIEEQSFGENLSTPNYQSVTVRLKLSGPLQNVIKWLVPGQQTEVVQGVTRFCLSSAG